MENPETRLIQRYFRKTMAHKEGAVVHHGDCDYFSIRVCTCGLHHDLQPLETQMVQVHYPDYWSEYAEYDKMRESIMHRPRKKKKA